MSHPQKVPGPLLSTSTSSRKKCGWVYVLKEKKIQSRLLLDCFFLSNLNKLIGILSGWL